MTAVVDIRISARVEAALTARGYRVCKLPPHPELPRPVASHPDMLVFFAQDAVFCTRSYLAVANHELNILSQAAQRPLCVLDGYVGGVYPRDVLLNAAPVGGCLLCLAQHTADEIVSRYRPIHVRQGYAKCSTVPVGENAIVTADPSIARAARENDLDVLSVRQGYVRLDGYSTGFLGGASSFSPYGDRREILFCGALSSHPDHGDIATFFRERGYEAVSLSDEPLTDVGTVFLIEGE